MYVIPRSHLSILNERDELQTPTFKELSYPRLA